MSTMELVHRAVTQQNSAQQQLEINLQVLAELIREQGRIIERYRAWAREGK